MYTGKQLQAMTNEELAEVEKSAIAVIEKFSDIPFKELTIVKRWCECFNKAISPEQLKDMYLEYIYDICYEATNLFDDNHNKITVVDMAKIIK